MIGIKIKPWGKFCKVFGANPRNRILEFFLESRELDFSIGNVSAVTELNRATTYNAIEELLSDGVIIPTRKISGAQLYKLNIEKEQVRLLVDTFNLVLFPVKKSRRKIKV